jgi:Cytochrome P460
MQSKLAGCLLVTLCLSGAEPRYDEKNRLLRPEGYREWVFVGSSIGMGYSEDAPNPERATQFHNIYIEPSAYRAYAASGKFPDKTMLVMEVVASATKESINKHGRFEDQFIGIEVALKDESKFPDKWAYFNFIGSGGAPLKESTPFRKEVCWSCHNKNGASDNVFVQFYPVLKAARSAATR